MDNLIAKVLSLIERPGTVYWIDQLELNIECQCGARIVIKYDGVFMHHGAGQQWGGRSTYLKLSELGWTPEHWQNLKLQVAVLLVSC